MMKPKPSFWNLAVLVLSLGLLAMACQRPDEPAISEEKVGEITAEGQVTPVNQTVFPYGSDLPLPSMRPQGLAISPDGRLVAVSGKTSELIIIDPDDLKIRQKLICRLRAN